MELGNMIFGNSRGSFPIERGVGYEEELYRLFHAIDPNRDNSWREYGVEFENEVFSVFPYYWGDCTCGFEEEDYEWDENNECAETCFSVRLKKYQNELEKEGITLFNDKSEEWQKLVSAWCLENGWSGWEGSGGHCDCGYNDKYEEWRKTHNHDTKCPIVKANFKHKETGFEINWYKYPLRDSYMSAKLSVEEFSKVIDTCIESITKV